VTVLSGFARRWPIFAAAALLLGIAAWFAGASHPRQVRSQTTDEARQLPVAALRAEIQPSYRVQRAFTGRATARQRSDLGFEQDGKVVEIAVDTGDRIQEGQLLARLDTARLDARRTELVAALAEASADLDLARKTRARTVRLFKDGHVSEQRRDETVAQADAAAARLARLEAQIASVDVDLEKSVLKAPYSGVIERRLVDEGNVIETGTPVVRLIETGALEAEIGFPLSFARRMDVGDHVPLRAENSELAFARVRSMVPAVRGETRTALVTFVIQGGVTDNIADGSLVTAELEDEIESSGFWLPLRALTADVRGLWRVYKLGDHATDLGPASVTFENVQILHSENGRAFVSGTVNDGDLLVAEGIERIVPGQTVRIVSIDAPGPPKGEG